MTFLNENVIIIIEVKKKQSIEKINFLKKLKKLLTSKTKNVIINIEKGKEVDRNGIKEGRTWTSPKTIK